MKWIGRLMLVFSVIVAALIAVYLLGPRLTYDLTVRFDPSSIGDDLEAYIAQRNAEHDDIIPGAEQQIVWADPATHTRTTYSVVYIHGFSATAAEIRPLPDMLAKNLGANLYFTRLEGHGRSDPDALGSATVNGWINDYAEAMAIGRMLGDKVIVMSVSTGGSITTWALTQPDLAKDTAAAIFVSPNYGIQAAGEFLLTGPWAEKITAMLLGPRRSFEPANEAHAANWTTDYPTKAIFPMAQAVKLARKAPVEKITVPALFVISDKDDVVRPDLTRKIVDHWNAPADLEDVGDTSGLSNHVLAGDILNPKMTEPTAEMMTNWLRKTLRIK